MWEKSQNSLKYFHLYNPNGFTVNHLVKILLDFCVTSILFHIIEGEGDKWSHLIFLQTKLKPTKIYTCQIDRNFSITLQGCPLLSLPPHVYTVQRGNSLRLAFKQEEPESVPCGSPCPLALLPC